MSTKFDELTFDSLALANAARVGLFTNAQGELAHTEVDGFDWSLNDWAVAVGGEAGELLNVCKKIRRGDFADDPQRSNAMLMQEVGDIAIYLDLFCRRAGFTLAEAVGLTFNAKSREKNLPVFLNPDFGGGWLMTDPVDDEETYIEAPIPNGADAGGHPKRGPESADAEAPKEGAA